MNRDDDKIISLEQRRAREVERKAQQAAAAREAQRRRSLAEHGPAAVRTGRLIGRVVGLVILAVGIGSLAMWIYSLTR
jgi:actin-like ATPase involved in cell morphogenesis